MGSRSAAETVIAILTAFIDERTWTQAALAKRVGVRVPALRKHLDELSRRIPLEGELDHPHMVWSVPHAWFPGGIVLTADDAQELLRQLARAPATAPRDRLLLAIATASRQLAPSGVAHVAHAPADDHHLRVVEDACTRRVALSMRYYSAHTGHLDTRTVSVQRVLVGPLCRIVAHCHKSDELRYFRVSRIEAATLDDNTPFISAGESAVDAFVGASVGGFRDPTSPVRVAFVVRDPEARWVKDTLPIPMEVELIDHGIRVSAQISSVHALARFVVGLGEAARCETKELILAVHNLAQGALLANSPPIRSVMPNPSSDCESDAT